MNTHTNTHTQIYFTLGWGQSNSVSIWCHSLPGGGGNKGISMVNYNLPFKSTLVKAQSFLAIIH